MLRWTDVPVEWCPQYVELLLVIAIPLLLLLLLHLLNSLAYGYFLASPISIHHPLCPPRV